MKHYLSNVLILVEIDCLEKVQFLASHALSGQQEVVDVLHDLERHLAFIDLSNRPWYKSVGNLAKHMSIF